MAYFAVGLVPGVYLYPAGRQPQGRCPPDAEYAGCVGSHRHLARRKLELYCVGAVLLCAAGGGKAISAAVPPKRACLAAPVHAVLCGGGLGHLYRQPARRTAGAFAAKAVCAAGGHFSGVLSAQLRRIFAAGLRVFLGAAAQALAKAGALHPRAAGAVCRCCAAECGVCGGRHQRHGAVCQFRKGGYPVWKRRSTAKMRAKNGGIPC